MLDDDPSMVELMVDLLCKTEYHIKPGQLQKFRLSPDSVVTPEKETEVQHVQKLHGFISSSQIIIDPKRDLVLDIPRSNSQKNLYISSHCPPLAFPAFARIFASRMKECIK